MIKIKDFFIDNDKPFVLIAGPCVIESDELTIEIAKYLYELTKDLDIPFIFKASYLKDNRTSGKSYRGPGLEAGMNVFRKIKEKFDVPILTDIHHPEEAEMIKEVVDIIQIPAFMSRQTSLLEAAAKTGKVINIKKGQFLAPEDMKFTADKVLQAGNTNVMLTERGTSFGYHNLIVDMRSFRIMKDTGLPVIYDVTHSLQKPSENGVSGGTPEFAFDMAKSAIAQNIAGLFIETHPSPDNALSDAKSMLNLNIMPKFLDKIKKLDTFVKKL